MSTLDLAAENRRVERFAVRLSSYLGALARAEGAALPDSPFEFDRALSGKAHVDALATEAERGGPNAVLATALSRWSFTFLLARISDPLLRDAANTTKEECVRVVLDAPLTLTARDARQRLLTVRTDHERARLFRALEDVGTIGGPFREVFARRAEARKRAGTPSHDVQFAHDFVRATDAMFVDLKRRAEKSDEATAGPQAAIVRLGLAFGAGEGFSANLSSAFFADVLRELAPSFNAKLLTGLVLAGPASFLRALDRIGRARRRASRPSHVPFALFFDPDGGDTHRFGALYGALPILPSFQKRALGLGAVRARDETRVFARAAFFHLRRLCVRVLLGDDAERGTLSLESFRERTAAAFGTPLGDALAGAWPEPRADEPARARAALGTWGTLRDLESRFDEDWFRNPRAHAELEARARTPFAVETEPTPIDVVELSRFFEGELA